MPEGYLRESILVRHTGDHFALSHPCWTLELPREWVEQTPGVMDFLKRRRPLAPVDSQAADLGRLLLAQGCLTASEHKLFYSLREVDALFTSIRNEWYGHYYRHPIWQMLRSGELPKARFIAWAVYNYFLSRSAGISASRFVAFSGRRELREPLARSMIEEYSHFSEYYHIHHASLDIPEEEIENYVQLPASTAFCQQMLRMAEEDWLGHVLIAYFQESTVRFYRDCFKFYSEVEASYGLIGFFKPWQDHIRVDIDCLHAESIADLFDSDEEIAIDDLRRSLGNAWFAYRELLASLDEITDGPGAMNDEWRRRAIGRGPKDSTDDIPLANKWTKLLSVGTTPANLLKLSKQLQGEAPGAAPATPAGSDRDSAFLNADVTRSVYRALGFAGEAGLILALGKLAEENGTGFAESDHGACEVPGSAEAMAIANFLRELAVTPRCFCFALHCLAGAAAGARPWLPVSETAYHALSGFLASQLENDPGSLVTSFAQLLELVARWEGHQDLCMTPNFFSGLGLGAQPSLSS